jgi:hypothetical protein
MLEKLPSRKNLENDALKVQNEMFTVTLEIDSESENALVEFESPSSNKDGPSLKRIESVRKDFEYTFERFRVLKVPMPYFAKEHVCSPAVFRVYITSCSTTMQGPGNGLSKTIWMSSMY